MGNERKIRNHSPASQTLPSEARNATRFKISLRIVHTGTQAKRTVKSSRNSFLIKIPTESGILAGKFELFALLFLQSKEIYSDAPTHFGWILGHFEELISFGINVKGEVQVELNCSRLRSLKLN